MLPSSSQSTSPWPSSERGGRINGSPLRHGLASRYGSVSERGWGEVEGDRRFSTASFGRLLNGQGETGILYCAPEVGFVQGQAEAGRVRHGDVSVFDRVAGSVQAGCCGFVPFHVGETLD